MRLTVMMLVGILFAVSVCLGAPDDDNGSARLYVRAVFTATHTSHAKSMSGDEEHRKQHKDLDEHLTVTFAGTTQWRVKDWVPADLTHNCTVTADGQGGYTDVEVGSVYCGKHQGRSQRTTTETGSWTFGVPSVTKTLSPILSPAGCVGITPVGTWMMSLSCYPNLEDLWPKGQWQRSTKWCCPTDPEQHDINRDDCPSDIRAMYLIGDAYQQTLGSDAEQKMWQGEWDVDKKGFYTSGHIIKDGGYPDSVLGSLTPAEDGFFTYSVETSKWHADVFYTISYNLTPPPVECIIETGPEYDKWEPKGGADEATVGNNLGISAHLQVKGKPNATPLQKGRFIFQLVDASKEPGVALNLPLTGAKTDPDLKFVDSGGMEIKDEGKRAETVSDKMQTAQANLGCYDYGAYGKVRVTCQLTDGSVVYGHLQGEPGKEELSVPKDDNNNHVADSWESREGVSGKADCWDGEQEPSLDGRAGDGLTLYEEYRGLVHKGQIVRLEPLQKDLVIVNEAGDKMAAGLKLFESASGIHVVELSKGELADDRLVNKNCGEATLGPQYGLRLVSEPLGAGIIGISLPDRVKTSPKDCDKTVINSDLSFLPGASLQAMTAVGIAHEIGHSLGAQHHGDSGSGTTRENLAINDAATKIYGIDGAEITQRPYTLQGLIEEKMNGGESSGAQECVMRNSSFFQWVKHVDRMGVAAYYAVPPTAPGTIFCGVTAGTGINATGNTPTCYFGQAADGRGACQTHMRVNDH